jgi:hypothetical protein
MKLRNSKVTGVQATTHLNERKNAPKIKGKGIFKPKNRKPSTPGPNLNLGSLISPCPLIPLKHDHHNSGSEKKELVDLNQEI